MNEIQAVSAITVETAAEYLRITELTENDSAMLSTLINVATSFMSQYTGRTIAELDNYPDFVIVALILIQDMWDTRSLYVDEGNVNKVVESILGLHSVNLLPNNGGGAGD